MTTPAEFLAANAYPAAPERQPGDFRRNASGAPWVTDPSGELVKSGERKGQPKMRIYGRPSGRGKLIENTHNLQKWGERMTAYGLVLARELLDQVQAIPHDVDSDEWKRAMDGLVVQAKDAARAMLAAERGTLVHGLTEDDDEGRKWINRALAGEDLGIPVAAQEALVQAWRRMLAEHEFEVLAVEAAVVCDRWRLAGTLDRIVRLTRDVSFVLPGGEVVTLPAGTVLILDIKTGKMTLGGNGAIRYWHSYAIQLAAYALGVPYDVDTDTRAEWPFAVSTEWAIIAHLDVLGAIEDGEARCTLVLCDLRQGIEAGDLCAAANEWPRRQVFTVPGMNPDRVVTVPVEDRGAEEARTAADTSAPPQALTGDCDECPRGCGLCPSATVDRAMVVERARALVAAGHAERLALRWPEGVPGLAEADDHTPEQLAAILAAVRHLEDETNAPFHPDDTMGPHGDDVIEHARAASKCHRCGVELGELAESQEPVCDPCFVALAHVPPDEGDDVSKGDVAEIARVLGDLTDEQRAAIGALAWEANAAGRGISLAVRPSVRRFEIARALIGLARSCELDEDITRGLLAHVIGDESAEWPTQPLGAVVGALSIDEASRLAELAPLIGTDALLVTFDPEGRAHITPTAP